MDIVGVREVGADDLGVVATVTFAGNFEHAMGKGHLARAAAAFVLVAEPGKGSSAGLVAQGPGRVGKVYRETASTTVGSFRNGNELTFFISGPGFGNVQSVDVETVASATGLGKRGASAVAAAPPEIRRGTGRSSSSSARSTTRCSTRMCPTSGASSTPRGASTTPSTSPAVGLDPGRLVAFRAKVDGLRAKCPPPDVAEHRPPPAVAATFAWSFFGSNAIGGVGPVHGAGDDVQLDQGRASGHVPDHQLHLPRPAPDRDGHRRHDQLRRRQALDGPTLHAQSPDEPVPDPRHGRAAVRDRPEGRSPGRSRSAGRSDLSDTYVSNCLHTPTWRLR